MNHLTSSFLLVTAAVLLAPTSSHAQADIPPSETRVAVVASISKVMESRGKPAVVPEDCISPFTGKVRAAAPEPDFSNLPVPVGLSGPELLSQLAGKIPSTGTLVFGGNALLLLGPKRVKVGDTITVNHDGKDYQLTLTSVNSTSFTVKMGDEVSTRPIRKR
jgi:hypothetical protein